jgi:integrase
MNKALERMGKEYAPASWNLYVNCIRAFYKWMNGGDEYPDCVRKIRLKKVRREDYIIKKLLSEAEVKALLRGCDNPRDRAMIAVARATGVRRGELLGIHLRDIERMPYGFKILVSGKTGSHKTPPIDREFARLLNVWLEHHPMRDNPDAPLWPRMKNNPFGSRFDAIGPTGAQDVIKRAARNAGLKRNVHWHMLRHTETSATVKWVSRASRNLTHGWSQYGNTAAIYEHLADSDAEEEYLRKDGLAKPQKQVDGFGMTTCAYCGAENPTEAKSCHYCLVPLKSDDAKKYLDQKAVLEALSDKDILPRFIEFLENLKKER